MAVVVGVVDHVMDEVGAKLIASYGMLTEALRRRRVETGDADRFVERLLGLELTQATYVRGAAFVAGVVERAGAEAWPACGRGRAMLPSPPRVDAPRPVAGPHRPAHRLMRPGLLEFVGSMTARRSALSGWSSPPPGGRTRGVAAGAAEVARNGGGRSQVAIEPSTSVSMSGPGVAETPPRRRCRSPRRRCRRAGIGVGLDGEALAAPAEAAGYGLGRLAAHRHLALEATQADDVEQCEPCARL